MISRTERHLVPILALFCFAILNVGAEPRDVYFGTGGRGAEGIYRATFDPAKGKLSPSILAAEVGSPGFLALHPDGKNSMR